MFPAVPPAAPPVPPVFLLRKLAAVAAALPRGGAAPFKAISIRLQQMILI
ncbi:hypothetical protein HanIR_Chr04g0200371 [Helianthus annuus]|nr:hypothetical protein HanIR_Chr04g0200371 [Helianthus annuus]